MELKVWGPDSGLPSIDCVCLQSMAYAKFCGAPVNFVECNNPWASPTGRLPVFQHGSKVKLTVFNELTNHLKKQNFNSDVTLSETQKADITAFNALLKHKLAPALLYVWWCDERNYVTFTRPWYAKRLPFPLNYFIPGQLQKSANQIVSSVYDYELNSESERETLVYKSGQECLRLLSEHLSDQEFFFGKTPCSLDALVFGYLAPLLKIELPNSQLRHYLSACGNLVQFVARILQRYFPLQSEPISSKGPTTSSSNGNAKKSSNSDVIDKDFPHKWRDIFLWGLFSMSAMLAYAFSTGILSISIEDDHYEDRHRVSREEEDDDEDEEEDES